MASIFFWLGEQLLAQQGTAEGGMAAFGPLTQVPKFWAGRSVRLTQAVLKLQELHKKQNSIQGERLQPCCIQLLRVHPSMCTAVANKCLALLAIQPGGLDHRSCCTQNSISHGIQLRGSYEHSVTL